MTLLRWTKQMTTISKDERRGWCRIYKLAYSCRAQKFLRKLDNLTAERIRARLERLEITPVPSDAKWITRHNGESLFRYRIGDYRALYKVKEDEQVVLVGKIDKRSRVYD